MYIQIVHYLPRYDSCSDIYGLNLARAPNSGQNVDSLCQQKAIYQDLK